MNSSKPAGTLKFKRPIKESRRGGDGIYKRSSAEKRR